MFERRVLRDGEAELTVVPERGAIVTSVKLRGEELLYLEEATLADPAKSVRGGIPVLFPIAGKLPEGGYLIAGRRYELPQHGFARNRAWTVKDASPSSLSMELASDDATRKVFPFEFEAKLTVAIQGGEKPQARIALAVRNTGTAPLPFHAGFHPYFLVPDRAKKDARVETVATRAFDNRTGKSGPLATIDFTAPEVDLHLEDHDEPKTTLSRGEGRAPIRLNWSANARRMVLWTLAGKDFICVEPWTAPGGALAAGTLPLLAPGATAELALRISVL